MLTMGKPIQPKSARAVGTLGEMFGERIRANYQQMQGHINPVDILHFLLAPPEFFIAGSEMTTLVNQMGGRTADYPHQMSFINNVLNRILVSADLTFTYQDRVFVENMLRKLGVTDVREWMRQVRMMKEEIRTVRELLSLSESGRDAIRLIQEYRRDHTEIKEILETGGKSGVPNPAVRLAAAVLKRLQTAEIYREVGGYATFRCGNRTTIDRRELSFGEQNIAASYLTFSDYQSRVFEGNQYTVCNLPDRYQLWEVNFADEMKGQTVNRLLQTVLLHAVGQIFHSRYEEFTQRSEWLHEITDALHVSVQNTIRRYAEFPERTVNVIRDREAYHEAVRHFEKLVMKDRHLFEAHREGGMDVTHRTDVKLREHQPQAAAALRMEREETAGGRKPAALRMEREETVSGRKPAVLRMEREETAGSRNLAALRLERAEEIRKQLEHINRQNIERMEKLSEYTSLTEGTGRRIDRETTKKDVLRALAGPEQIMTLQRKRETVNAPERTQEMANAPERAQETEKLREILGEETVRVFETIRGYRQDPGRYPYVTAVDGQAVHMFLRDIEAAGKARESILKAAPAESVNNEMRYVNQDEMRHVEQTAAAPALRGTVLGAPSDGRRLERRFEETGKIAHLLHRQSVQTVSEERLREMMRIFTKDTQMRGTVGRKKVSEEERTAEIVRSKINEIRHQQDEKIARMVSRSVKRQFDTLSEKVSEKVYGKLEKRMDAERRRRGL